MKKTINYSIVVDNEGWDDEPEVTPEIETIILNKIVKKISQDNDAGEESYCDRAGIFYYCEWHTIGE